MAGEKDKDRLSYGQIMEELDGEPFTIAESQVIVPRRGKLFRDIKNPKTGEVIEGACKIAVIRPCVSRGKKIGGLHPIYTPQMLAENADVFTDWPMYEDHLAEEAVENFRERLAEAKMGDVIAFLEERARKIRELGGRVEASYYNPELTFKTDKDEGYQKGGVEGIAVPQPGVRAMLEADPKILHNSINAWPSGARPGTAPWDTSVKGMLIEGIRKKPRGSVDWVYRGGAGGRPLLAEEDADLAVSVLEAYYAAAHGQGPLSDEDQVKKELKDLKPDELQEYLEENASHLLPALKKEEEPAPTPSGGGGISEERLQELLTEQRESLTSDFEQKLKERDEDVDERVKEELKEREGARTLSTKAFELIREAEDNGFPKAWATNLRARYAVLASGPAEGLRVQEEDLKVTEGEGEKAKEVTLTPEALIERRVKEDLRECVKLMEAAGGSPAIRGLGPSGPDPQGEGSSRPKAPEGSAFRQFMRESGDLKEEDGDDAKSEDEQVTELVGKARH